jgi:hypothetical protein
VLLAVAVYYFARARAQEKAIKTHAEFVAAMLVLVKELRDTREASQQESSQKTAGSP